MSSPVLRRSRSSHPRGCGSSALRGARCRSAHVRCCRRYTSGRCVSSRLGSRPVGAVSRVRIAIASATGASPGAPPPSLIFRIADPGPIGSVCRPTVGTCHDRGRGRRAVRAWRRASGKCAVSDAGAHRSPMATRQEFPSDVAAAFERYPEARDRFAELPPERQAEWLNWIERGAAARPSSAGRRADPPPAPRRGRRSRRADHHLRGSATGGSGSAPAAARGRRPARLVAALAW